MTTHPHQHTPKTTIRVGAVAKECICLVAAAGYCCRGRHDRSLVTRCGDSDFGMQLGAPSFEACWSGSFCLFAIQAASCPSRHGPTARPCLHLMCWWWAIASAVYYCSIVGLDCVAWIASDFVKSSVGGNCAVNPAFVAIGWIEQIGRRLLWFTE